MGLRLKYMGLRTVYVPLWHMLLMMPSQSRTRSRTRIDDSRTSPDLWKTINCSTKGWKRQNNGRKKWLVRQHLSNLLWWPVSRTVDGGQYGVISTALPSISSELSTWGTWCPCVYLVKMGNDFGAAKVVHFKSSDKCEHSLTLRVDLDKSWAKLIWSTLVVRILPIVSL